MSETKILFGPRLGKQGKIRLGCSAIIFDEGGDKVLLTRRTDNGLWCLPGGAMEPGESAAEACAREVQEETALQVRVKHLVGVYSDPDQLVVYPDGTRVHIVALSFEAEVLGGRLGLSSETTEAGYFTLAEMESMPMVGPHMRRVEDARAGRAEAFVK